MKTAAELFVELLAEWGVDLVFGFLVMVSNGIVEGLRRHQDRVQFILEGLRPSAFCE
jgi:pyruvate dehydrogenase (quinone)/pyruvate oxidase